MLKNFRDPGVMEAGCDEAGRGCLAGPVVAAAVILPKEFHHPWLNDSKKITARQRDTLRPIIQSAAISYAIGQASPTEIDEINILQASLLAMHRALEQLKRQPEYILVDGNHFNAWKNIPHSCIVKGDSIYTSIAAASVLAKTFRDEAMGALDKEYPAYQWKQNKGYPTIKHREAILQNGITPLHRRSFRLLPVKPELPFTNSY